MTRYLPIVAGVLLIVGLTIVQGRMTDRLSGTNVSAEQRAELLRLVPKSFGDWHGEDKPVDENVKGTAGAIGPAVSRNYRNARTGERVDLWLIVGHARDISAHTPNICYPASGFEARAKENGLYPFVMDGRETPFWTNTFYREDVSGRQLIRVFWTWFNPESEENQGKVVWEAPQNARWHFGNTRALYKMYFTSSMSDSMETAEQSACIHFARDFLPEVEKALTQVDNKSENADASSAATPGGEQSTVVTEAENATEASSNADASADEASATDEKSAAAPATDSALPANLAPGPAGPGESPLFDTTPPPTSDDK